ncbi:glutamate--tRNA ligase [Microbacter margulisiae]|uniref:Glutamate--tRNA ligase n=1 Tax=Microbacter margulisiae TaxID=1350067 RepID=A0A7W5H1A8_9PORP|nr:glutamate--tRNA ligase [Microbacter margulisiae]MBB3187398.1 glutamyl-tRNA synthetase [Microbacter margulisiae]
MRVRVRFAPSPTGPLHIGGVRTALYNYLFAKQHGGDFLLRIEDTDSARLVPGAEDYINGSLQWLGIKADEGVREGGDYAPYKQSERRQIYTQYVDLLLKEGKAYYAFDTPEELDAKRNEIKNFQYDAATRGLMRNSLTLPTAEVEQRLKAGEQYVVRLRIEPDEEVRVTDLIRGEVVINSTVLDDKVLFKSSDGLPTYHLANVVDDHLMEISHVIRGEEWLPSAPLHVLLYRAFGWEDSMPQFAHLPLLLKPEGNGKLSKRDGDRLGFPVFPLQWQDPKTGDISSGYREAGYYPEAVINFLALLGWHPETDQEIFTMQELIEQFSFERCSKSGAKFDFEKAKWFNHHYLQQKPVSELVAAFQPVLKSKGIEAADEMVSQVVSLMRERINFMQDLWDNTDYFFAAPTVYDEKSVQKHWKPETKPMLEALVQLIESLPSFGSDAQADEAHVMAWIQSNGYKTGNVMNPFRIALVGASKGPHLFDLTSIIGKEETLQRLRKAMATLV